jgi:hypothetical protein
VLAEDGLVLGYGLEYRLGVGVWSEVDAEWEWECGRKPGDTEVAAVEGAASEG